MMRWRPANLRAGLEESAGSEARPEGRRKRHCWRAKEKLWTDDETGLSLLFAEKSLLPYEESVLCSGAKSGGWKAETAGEIYWRDGTGRGRRGEQVARGRREREGERERRGKVCHQELASWVWSLRGGRQKRDVVFMTRRRARASDRWRWHANLLSSFAHRPVTRVGGPCAVCAAYVRCSVRDFQHQQRDAQPGLSSSDPQQQHMPVTRRPA